MSTNKEINPPQNTKSKNAAIPRVYGPAANVESRKADFAAAVAAGPVSFYGPVILSGLLGLEKLSFDDFLRAPEVERWLIAQEDSDAMSMRARILRDGTCRGPSNKSKTYLNELCRQLSAERPQGVRYFQRIKNSLWNCYIGVLKGRSANAQAFSGEVERLEARRAYKERERVRLQARRNPRLGVERLTVQIARLKEQERKLLTQAKKHEESSDRHRKKADACRKRAQAKKRQCDVLITQSQVLASNSH